MSLYIANGQINTTPPVSFSGANSVKISSNGLTSDVGNVSLNTPSGMSIGASGIATSSGLSLAPITTAPSVNADGFSVSGTVSGVKPPAPSITSVSLGGSAGQVVINFSLSSVNCGSPITLLTFISYIGGVQQGTASTSNVNSPYTYSGLTAGQIYTFAMYASTASYANGTVSSQSSGIQVGTVPGAPNIVAGSISGSTGQWYIQWLIPANGGLSIDFSQTQLQVRQGSTSVNDGSLVGSYINSPLCTPDSNQGSTASNGNGYTISLSTLAVGTYQFYVQVKNTIGYGSWSNSYSLTRASPPAAPTSVGLYQNKTSPPYTSGYWNIYCAKLQVDTPIQTVYVNFVNDSGTVDFQLSSTSVRVIGPGSGTAMVFGSDLTGTGSAWPNISPPGNYRARVKIETPNGISNWSDWSVDDNFNPPHTYTVIT